MLSWHAWAENGQGEKPNPHTPLPGSSMSLLKFFQELGQRKTTEMKSCEDRQSTAGWGGGTREGEGWLEIADWGGCSGKPGDMRHGVRQKLPRDGFCPFYPLFFPSPSLPILIPPLLPPHIFIGSGKSVDLHVRQSLATHTERKPQPWRCGSVSSRCCSTV